MSTYPGTYKCPWSRVMAKNHPEGAFFYGVRYIYNTISMPLLGFLARQAGALSALTSFSLQVYRRTAIPGAFLLQCYSYAIILTAVLQLCHHSNCSFINIGRIAADECEQMCLTNVIDVSYDMTGAKHVLWRTHCCRRTSTNEFR